MRDEMTAEEIKKFHEICRHVLEECNNKYAKAYANAGLVLTSAIAIQVQILYLQSNLQYWRGDDARKTKAELKTLQ